jgi:hypothetical protein
VAVSVYGSPVSVNLRKPNLKQDNPKAGDYVYGKDGYAKTEDIQSAVNDALAKAKASGEFDGKDGKDGIDGKDGSPGADGQDGKPGADGADGITPHIGNNGNWYIGETDTGKPSRGADGRDGEPGKDGNDGQPGKDGAAGSPGKDGNGIKSAMLNADYTLTLTFDDSTTYTTPSIRGATGAAGKNGSDASVTAMNITSALGYTPAKQSDVEQKVNKQGLSLGVGGDGLVYLFVDGAAQGNGLDIKAEVVAGDVVGYVDSNNTIILTGALADGTYMLKYEDVDGEQTEIGELTLGADMDINLLTRAVNSSRQPFIGTNGEIGYQTGYRIDNNGQYSAKEGMFTTGYIPVETGNTISIENMRYTFMDANGYRCKIVFYDENFVQLSGVAPATDISGYPPFYHEVKSVSGVVSNGKFLSEGILSQFTVEQTGVAYMRICVLKIDATSTVKKV